MSNYTKAYTKQMGNSLAVELQAVTQEIKRRREPLYTIYVPRKMIDAFVARAKANTDAERETVAQIFGEENVANRSYTATRVSVFGCRFRSFLMLLPADRSSATNRRVFVCASHRRRRQSRCTEH